MRLGEETEGEETVIHENVGHETVGPEILGHETVGHDSRDCRSRLTRLWVTTHETVVKRRTRVFVVCAAAAVDAGLAGNSSRQSYTQQRYMPGVG